MMNKTSFLLTCVLITQCVFAQEPEQEEPVMTVHFLSEESWDLAREEGAAQNKYILVDAYTDWCYWCKVQDKNTFTNDEVGAFLNEHFVSVKLDFERGDGVVLARKYRVQGYPCLLLFNPQGQLVGKLFGYNGDNQDFIASVEKYLDPTNQLAPVGDPDVLNPGFPDFYVNAFGAGEGRKWPKAAEVASWLSTQDDLYTEAVYNVLIMMPLDSAWSSYFLENHEAYASRFFEDEVAQKLQSLLLRPAYAAMEKGDEEAMQTALEKAAIYMPAEEAEWYRHSLWGIMYQRTENFDKLLPLMAKLSQNEKYDDFINTIAWEIYTQESTYEIAIYQAAAGWMKPVIERNATSYAYLDTYAALLYKAGDYEFAQRMAERAIKEGTLQGEDVSETESLLESIEMASQKR